MRQNKDDMTLGLRAHERLQAILKLASSLCTVGDCFVPRNDAR